MAFDIVSVSNFLSGRLYRLGAIELIHESSLYFGGGPRPLRGHAARDQPCEFWSFSSVIIVLLTGLLT